MTVCHHNEHRSSASSGSWTPCSLLHLSRWTLTTRCWAGRVPSEWTRQQGFRSSTRTIVLLILCRSRQAKQGTCSFRKWWTPENCSALTSVSPPRTRPEPCKCSQHPPTSSCHWQRRSSFLQIGGWSFLCMVLYLEWIKNVTYVNRISIVMRHGNEHKMIFLNTCYIKLNISSAVSYYKRAARAQ